jgi:nicotinate-nucleotide adenylyltransferase
MRIGLFFGSFNPIHHGHLIIASHIIQENLVDEVWFVISPQNPFKNQSSLLNENHRLYLAQEAIEGADQLRVSNIEFKLPRPSYTVDSMAYLREKYPSHRFSILMGSDGFENLPKWKNATHLIKNYAFIIYPRKDHPVTDNHGANIQVTNAPLIEISSTRIRELIRERKSIRYYVPESVRIAIEKNMFYYNRSENPAE